MKKTNHQQLHAASAEIVDEMNSEIQSMEIKRIKGDFWLLFARDLMELLPRQTVDDTFLEVHARIQEALKLATVEQNGNFGAFAQDALTDWAYEAREHIAAVKQQDS